MALNEHEKSQIRSLIQDQRWGVLVKLSDEFMAHIKNDDPVRETEWDTIKATISQGAKIEGIKNFIQEIFKQVT